MIYCERHLRNGQIWIWLDRSRYQAGVQAREDFWGDEEIRPYGAEPPPLPEPDVKLESDDADLLVACILRGPLGYTGPMGPSGRDAGEGA